MILPEGITQEDVDRDLAPRDPLWMTDSANYGRLAANIYNLTDVALYSLTTCVDYSERRRALRRLLPGWRSPERLANG